MVSRAERKRDLELERAADVLIRENSKRTDEYPAHDNRYFRRQDRRWGVEHPKHIEWVASEARGILVGWAYGKARAICGQCGFDSQQESVVMAYWVGATHAEIAAEHRVSESTVRLWLGRLVGEVRRHPDWVFWEVLAEVFRMHWATVRDICQE